MYQPSVMIGQVRVRIGMSARRQNNNNSRLWHAVKNTSGLRWRQCVNHTRLFCLTSFGSECRPSIAASCSRNGVAGLPGDQSLDYPPRWKLCSVFLAVLDPRVGHTTDVLSPLIPVLSHSDWLFHGESCPRLDVVHPGRVWSSSPVCTWHCSLHYLFLQATPITPLFPRGVTIVCYLPCFDGV